MSNKITPPVLNLKNFHCPHCKVFALQRWSNLTRDNFEGGGSMYVPDCNFALCDNCEKYTLWVGNKMIFPESVVVSDPNEDLNEEVKKDYLEAASILEKSPKGAAALLRLALQKLFIQLGKKGDLNNDIKNLVIKGLSVRVQQSLDILRVIGNNSVHPGKIDINDNRGIAIALFDLINHIAESLISEPKRIDEIYGSLPEEERKKIEERDRPPK